MHLNGILTNRDLGSSYNKRTIKRPAKVKPIVNYMINSLIAAVSAFIASIFEGIKSAATVYIFALVLPAVGVVGAATSIHVAQTGSQRINQVRAVVTDTLRHPIDLNLALNPAFHGNRDELDKREELVKRYKTAKGVEDLPTYFTIVGLTGSDQKSKKKSGTTDDGRFAYSRKEWLESIENSTDEEERAHQFLIREETERFNAAVGGTTSQGVRVAVNPVITDPGSHGLQFTVNVLKTRNVVTATITDAHSNVIEILGEEEYTESFKVEAFREAGIRYIVSIIRGDTNVGPATYVNSMSDTDILGVATDALKEHLTRTDPSTPNQAQTSLNPKSFTFQSNPALKTTTFNPMPRFSRPVVSRNTSSNRNTNRVFRYEIRKTFIPFRGGSPRQSDKTDSLNRSPFQATPSFYESDPTRPAGNPSPLASRSLN